MRVLRFPRAAVGLMFVLGLVNGDPAKESEADRIARLIQKLGHDDFGIREAASADLEAIGEPARDALRKAAANSDDPEIRKRAEDILRTIARRVMEQEREKLQGNWSLVSYEMDGRPIKGEDKTHLISFKGERWSISLGGALFQGGTITSIEPTGKHNAIDLLISEGSNVGATAYSICVVDRDTLRYLNCGLPRPAEFATKPGDGRHYLTFRRVKP